MAGKATQQCSTLVENLQNAWPGFDFTVNDIMNPTFSSVIKFYEKLLSELEIPVNELKMELLQHTSCQESFKDILFVYVIYICTNGVLNYLQLMTHVEIFTLTDLLNPSAKRIRSNIMLLTNFVLYSQNFIMDTVLPVREKLTEDFSELDHLYRKLDEINVKLNAGAIQHTKNIDRKAETEHEIEKFQKSSNEQFPVMQQVAAEKESLENQLSLLEEENRRLMEELQTESALQEELKTLMVNDYETILSEQKRLQKELSEVESGENDYSENMEKKTQTEQNCLQILEKVNNLIEHPSLEMLLKKYETKQNIQDTIEKRKIEIVELDAYKIELMRTRQQVDNEILSMNEKSQAFNLKWDNRSRILNDETKALEENLIEIRKNYSNALKLTEDFHKKVELILARCEKLQRNFEIEIKFCEKQYKSILESKGVLDNRLMGVLEQMSEDHNF